MSRYAQLNFSQTVSPQMAYGARKGLWPPTHPSPKQLGPGSRDWLGPPLGGWLQPWKEVLAPLQDREKGALGLPNTCAEEHSPVSSHRALNIWFGLTWLALEKKAGKADRRARRAWRIYGLGFLQKLWEEMGC